MEELAAPTLLITGIMASGKSTVAQRLAERLDRSVHLRGDIFRRMIVRGRVDMEPSPSDEALAQLRLRYQLAAHTAQQYCAMGFAVVYQDVIVGPALGEVIALHQAYPLYVVVLCPSPEVALQRDATRHKQAYGDWTPKALDHELRTNIPRVGLWVDNSAQTVEETVEAILARLSDARVAGSVP
ncbi:MAG: AAA family ATPase [Chloroflexi bacterium]|nr:AAA family ATPase [Chloroflexota bacterium]